MNERKECKNEPKKLNKFEFIWFWIIGTLTAFLLFISVFPSHSFIQIVRAPPMWILYEYMLRIESRVSRNWEAIKRKNKYSQRPKCRVFFPKRNHKLDRLPNLFLRCGQIKKDNRHQKDEKIKCNYNSHIFSQNSNGSIMRAPLWIISLNQYIIRRK